MGSLESVQTVWITYVVVVIWADKMLLERSLSSTLFALGSQAEIYYGWKPLQLSDVSAGLRALKISAEINSMSCDLEYLQQLRWKEKKAQVHSFNLSLWFRLVAEVMIHRAKKRVVQYLVRIIQVSEMLIDRLTINGMAFWCESRY